MSTKTTIYHIAQALHLRDRQAADDYYCPSLTVEGFIHCCNMDQLAGVVSRYYCEIDDLILLLINVDMLTPALIYENTVGGNELFPHIYGPVNADAIIDVLPFGLRSSARMELAH